MEGRDQGEAGASRAPVCGCPFAHSWLPTERGRPAEPHAGVLTALPSRRGPRPCFLSPGLPGLLALTVPEPLGGWWGGTVARPASPASHPMLLSPVGISGAV